MMNNDKTQKLNETTCDEYIKCPLNYVGGKTKLLKQILPLFPNKINKFLDLFCGGCNVGINVNAEEIIFNDKQKEIIDLYNVWYNDGYNKTVDYIDKRIKEYNLTDENKDGYYSLREEYNSKHNPRDLFVLISHGFFNQIRFNKKGGYNIPYGKDRSFNQVMRRNLELFINTLFKKKKVIFSNKSFDDVDLGEYNSNDFVYADPPYLITDASYNENGGWNEKNELKLFSILNECNNRGIKFALSNVLENKGKTNHLLNEWAEKNKYNIHHLNSSYSNCYYNSKDKGSNTTDEVLITNY